MKTLARKMLFAIVAGSLMLTGADIAAQNRTTRSTTGTHSSSSGSSSTRTSTSSSSSSSKSSAATTQTRSSSQSRSGSSSTQTRSTRSGSSSSSSASQSRAGSTSRSSATQTRSGSSSSTRAGSASTRSTRTGSGVTTPAKAANSTAKGVSTPVAKPGSQSADQNDGQSASTSRDLAPAQQSSTGVGRTGGGNEGFHGQTPDAVQNRSENPQLKPQDHRKIDYRQPQPFGHEGRHYFGYPVKHLPSYCQRHHMWGHDYFFYGDVWYRWHDSRYFVCRPPYGWEYGRWRFEFDPYPCVFSYYWSNWYMYDVINENYSVINEQNRQIAENNAVLARQNGLLSQYGTAQYESNSYNLAKAMGLVQSYAYADSEYYYDDGVFFILNADGNYQTIVPPAGALVEEIPDDYDTLQFDGQAYYQVDDTVYRVAVVAGRAYFEVLGQVQDW